MIPLRLGSTAPFAGAGDTKGDTSARSRTLPRLACHVAGVALGLLTGTGEVVAARSSEDLERRLHHVTSFVAVPLFVLANAGAYLGGGKLGDAAGARVAWAIAVGLVLGKLAAIAGATSCWV